MQYNSGQFGGRRSSRVDDHVVGETVIVHCGQMASRQPDRFATNQFPLLGDSERTGDTDQLNIQAGQFIQPYRQQIRGKQHLVYDQMITTPSEFSSRSTPRPQHAVPDLAVTDDQHRMTVCILASPVVPETVATKPAVAPTTPVRRHQTEQGVDPPVDERDVTLILDGPRQRGLSRARRAVEENHPRRTLNAPHPPTLSDRFRVNPRAGDKDHRTQRQPRSAVPMRRSTQDHQVLYRRSFFPAQWHHGVIRSAWRSTTSAAAKSRPRCCMRVTPSTAPSRRYIPQDKSVTGSPQ